MPTTEGYEMSDQEQDVVIYDSSLTLDQLKHMWCYMDEEGSVEFTEEEINKLGENINDAIHNTIEDFLNHRSN
jgi:hypothetical protein